MATFTTLEQAKEFFSRDEFAASMGIQLDEITDDSCVCSLKLRENGRTTSVINIDIVDDTGRDIAQFVGTGYKM